jgi:polysaccharide pyruvyl transferase WcaK-like protein
MGAKREVRRRIALFGLLGSGNIGNDGSLEALVNQLTRSPEIRLCAICAGPDEIRRRFGIPAVPMTWFRLDRPPRSRVLELALRTIGKMVDPPRTALLLRRVDLVVVPGMGILEDTLPLRPWGFPYALFGLTLAGRVTGTPVALVCVGATLVRNPVTRRIVRMAASMATYRSYRDNHSRDAAAAMGIDTSGDRVFSDPAFALTLPSRNGLAASPTVAVGVLAYRGRSEDRRDGERILQSYTARIVDLVTRLVDDGYGVRLLTGDPDDAGVAASVREAVLDSRPALNQDCISFTAAKSLEDLMEQILPARAVIASRYHNVLCALRLAKPTISIGYAEKSRVLMHDMGMREFSFNIDGFEVNQVMCMLRLAIAESSELESRLKAGDEACRKRLSGQWAELATLTG